MSVLEVERVSVEFGGVVAVDKVDISVEKGELFSLIGPNGAGKTTLFNVITGVYKPTQGCVRFGGEDVTRRRADQRAALGLARTFQELRLFEDMTVLENIAVGPLWQRGGNLLEIMFGLPRERRFRKECHEIADDLISRLGLVHRRDVAAGLLSHGEKRLVEIGRALALSPRILILDEPTAGLNTPNKMLFLNETLTMLRDRVETILLIEHDMDIVMEVSDRVAVMAHGRKIAEGSPAEIQRNPEVVREYFGT